MNHNAFVADAEYINQVAINMTRENRDTIGLATMFPRRMGDGDSRILGIAMGRNVHKIQWSTGVVHDDEGRPSYINRLHGQYASAQFTVYRSRGATLFEVDRTDGDIGTAHMVADEVKVIATILEFWQRWVDVTWG